MTTTVITQAPVKTSQHVASVGDRVSVQGVIRKMFDGPIVLHIIHDIDGNEFTVRRRKSMARGVGTLVHFEAVVKEHTEFRGIKRTDLTVTEMFRVLDDHAFLAKA